MRIVFMGSSTFAVPIVRALRNSADDKLVAVVTQPDRPSGRGQILTASPVKQLMTPTGVPVLTPVKVGEIAEELSALKPDVITVADYGQYIPSKIFTTPPHGSINVHPSLLPKYRGAAPVAWAIANGETMSGVTIQYLAKKMDSGAILLQQEFEIGPEETSIEFEKRMSEAGAALLLRALNLIRSGHLHATPQDESHATYARKLQKADGKIDWQWTSQAIQNRIRAFQPWPGTFCTTPRGSLKLLRVTTEDGKGKPGEVIACEEKGPLVATGDSAVRLMEAQPEGKKPMSGADLMRGRYVQAGDILS